MNGSKVNTKYDPSWGSVVSVGTIQDELEKIKQELLDLLNSGIPTSDPQIQSLNTRLGVIKNNELLNWDLDVRTAVQNSITGIQNSLTCPVGTAQGRLSTCDANNAIQTLTNSDLEGYVLVRNINGMQNKEISTDCKNGANYEWCYNDKVKLSDPKFDSYGKINFGICLLLGETANFNIYKVFLKPFDLEFMAENFKSGALKEIDLTDKSDIHDRIFESVEMAGFTKKFTDKIKAKILSNQVATIDKEYLLGPNGTAIDNPNFSIKKYMFPTSAYAAIGGVQAFELDFKLYRKKVAAINSTDLRNFMLDYRFTFRDAYAADFGDINLGPKGLVDSLNSFFTLQHEYGYRPYLVKVRIHKTDKFE